MAEIMFRDWNRSGRRREYPVPRNGFRADVRMLRDWGEVPHVWSGTDRDGAPLCVLWYSNQDSHAFWWYEISGKW